MSTGLGQAACDRCQAALVEDAAYCERCGARTRKARRMVRLAVRVELLLLLLVVALIFAFTWIFTAQTP
jgi:predicted nucleic acid-binding Zn ribbon protein